MKLKPLHRAFSVCAAADYSQVRWEAEYLFIGKTDEESSLVCLTEDVPANVLQREDGWAGFRVQGPLDFSLTGILAGLAETLAKNGIPIFAVSTYQTDYILIRQVHEQRALDLLARAGHEIVD